MLDRRILATLATGLADRNSRRCCSGQPTHRLPSAYGGRRNDGEGTWRAIAPMVDAAAPIIGRYGGAFLVRGGQTVAVEGAPPARIVIIEFSSLDAAKKFENSPEYTAIAPMRRKAADSRLFLAEGP